MKILSCKSAGLISVFSILFFSSVVQADTYSTERRHNADWQGATVINAGSGITVRNYQPDFSSRHYQHNRNRYNNGRHFAPGRHNHTPPGRSYHQNDYGRNYYSYSTGGFTISYDDSPYRNDRHHYDQPTRNERHHNTFLKDRFGNCYEVVRRNGRETRNRVPRGRCRF